MSALEIETENGTYVACEEHTTLEYIVLYRKVPLEEQVAGRKKELENGRLPICTPKCPLCYMRWYSVTTPR